MYCKTCGSKVQSDADFCSVCGETVVNTDVEASPKRTKKSAVAVLGIILTVALAVCALLKCFLGGDDAFDRLTSAAAKTFASPCKITVTNLSGSTVSELGDASIELVIPDALAKGKYALTAGDIAYYRQDDFEYYAFESNAGIFRKVAPDEEILGIELSLSKYFDYFAYIASGDYQSLAESINSETFAEDVISAGRFIKRGIEITETYFSDEYMTENYGFVYSEKDRNEKYSFSLSVNKAIDTLYEIVEGSKDCFAEADEYNEILDNIRNVRNEMGMRGDETAVCIEITISDKLIRYIDVEITENGKSDSARLDFSDYGTAVVDTKLRAEYDKRREQLGKRDYLVWYGSMSYSDYYEKD